MMDLMAERNDAPRAPGTGGAHARRPALGRPLRRAALACAALALAGVAAARPQAEPGPAPGERVLHVRVEGPLGVGVQSLLARALREAEPERDTLIIELDTPGGAVDVMWQIAQQVEGARKRGLRTVVWVNREASSAGAFLAMTSDFLYLVRHGSIGSATPVIAVPGGGVIEIPDGDLREKQYSHLRSEFRGWAEAHGYPPALAEAMVDPEVEVLKIYAAGGEVRYVTATEFENLRSQPGAEVTRLATIVPAGELLNMTGAEAVDLGFADGVRDSLDEVVSKLGLADAPVVSFVPMRSEELATTLDGLRVLLLIGALLFAYVEFKVPGFGIAGALSIACFGLLLFGRYLVGLADVPHFVAVGSGLVLIAVELFLLPGAIWPAVTGACLVIAGLVLAGIGPTAGLRHELGRQIFVDESFALMLGVLAALAGAALLSRFLPASPVGRRLVLAPTAAGPGEPSVRPGALGRARTVLRPVGKVVLDGEPLASHEASAIGGAIEAGARVRVVDVRAGRLWVELESGAAPAAEARA